MQNKRNPFVQKRSSKMTREELIAQNKILRYIIRHSVPPSLVAQIGFLESQNAELKRKLNLEPKADPRKYYLVCYDANQNRTGLKEDGNIAITFAKGEFSPSTALKLIREKKPKDFEITLTFWQEISEQAYEDWNLFATSK